MFSLVFDVCSIGLVVGEFHLATRTLNCFFVVCVLIHDFVHCCCGLISKTYVRVELYIYIYLFNDFNAFEYFESEKGVRGEPCGNI